MKFEPDKPIKSINDDTLGRTSFVKYFEEALIDYDQKESIVIGIFGDWGSGKTSLINMALENIEINEKFDIPGRKPVVIRFSPWNYSKQEEITTQFFKELYAKLGKLGAIKKTKKIGELLEKYARIVEPFSSKVSWAFRSAGKISKRLWLSKYGDLATVKAELNKHLESLEYKILVVIDDIDRLSNKEILKIFQLVKSVGDLNNLIYIMVFDKKYVIDVLESENIDGQKYIEKVIQVPIDIPALSGKELENILFKSLQRIIDKIPSQKWDQEYWDEVYKRNLRFFFKNIRDVVRYSNSLSFGYNILKGEVNAVDFFTITALRVFVPEVYKSIIDNRDIFLGTTVLGMFDQHFGMDDEAKKPFKEKFEKIVQLSQKYDSRMIENLLTTLFPKVLGLFQPLQIHPEEYENWRREIRICIPDFFDRYFLFTVPEYDLSQEEFESILRYLGDTDKLSDTIIELKRNRKAEMFLERLEDNYSMIPDEHIETTVTALLIAGDKVIEDEYGLRDIEIARTLKRLIIRLVHRLEDSVSRYELLLNSIKNVRDSIYTSCMIVDSLDDQHGKYRTDLKPLRKSEQTVSSGHLAPLENLVLEKIRNMSKESTLTTNEYLRYLLAAWKQWGSPEEVEQFIEDLISKDDGLVRFISSFLGRTGKQFGPDQEFKYKWSLSIKAVSELVELDKIEPRLRKLRLSTQYKEFEENQRLAIDMFLELYDAGPSDWY